MCQLSLAEDSKEIASMEWTGLFSDDVVASNVKTPLDALCGQMLPRMQYTAGQRDMLLMKHRYVVEYDDRFEHLSTTMVDYGVVDGDSSMARTVALPVGICMRLILQGVVPLAPGLYRPITPNLYNPILDEMAKENILYNDKVEKVVQK